MMCSVGQPIKQYFNMLIYNDVSANIYITYNAPKLYISQGQIEHILVHAVWK